jgi:hypothetical protein
VACRPGARQQPRNKELYNCCKVMAPQTSMFPWQQLHCKRGTVFSERSLLRCYKQSQLAVAVSGVSGLVSYSDNHWGSVVSCCCEKLVAEARDSLGTQRNKNVCHWKLLPSNGSENVTVDTKVCVAVNCKV